MSEKKENRNRIKKWFQFNKPAVICISITIVYTLIMLGIIVIFGSDMNGCSSGSLSSNKNESVTVETSMKTD
jgi:hypothetical protein